MRRSFSMKKNENFRTRTPSVEFMPSFSIRIFYKWQLLSVRQSVCRLSFLQMFFSVLRPTLKIFPRRFLSSQTSILPYEIDRFNAARVRVKDWPENIEAIRDILSS
jgi:hypothetical protein